MTPPPITIINADCMTLPLDMFEACDDLITDPPFSEHVHANPVSTHTIASGGPAARDFGFSAITPEQREFTAAVAALMKRWTVVHSDLQGAHDWDAAMTAADVEPVRWVPWIRWSQPQISGDRPPSGAEFVLLYHAMQPRGPRGGDPKPRGKSWNGRGNLTHFDSRCLRGDEKHPAEKPLDLMLEIVSAFSDPGETVLDLFGGRGTTAQACQLLGRGCVSIEQNELWCIETKRRIHHPSKAEWDRAQLWIDRASDYVATIPAPKDPSQKATYDRAQRMLADAKRVQEFTQGKKVA